MNSILDGLTESATPATDEQAPSLTETPVQKSQRVLDKVSSGDVPGVFIPKDFKGVEDTSGSITADTITKAGLGIYKPFQEGITAVLFNPKIIGLEALQEADKNSELDQVLPSISSFFPESAPADAGVGGPSKGVVPVMPSSTFGPDAQKKAAEMRMKSLGAVEPSKRTLPGGGAVLNGLLKQTF